MHRNDIVVAGPNGGELLLTRDGEVLLALYVPPGRHRAGYWFDLVSPGEQLEEGDGVVVFQAAHRLTVQTLGSMAYESAANPDFRVTNATRLAREMEVKLSRLENLERRLSARDRALTRSRGPELELEKPAKGEPVEPEAGSADETFSE